MAATNGSGGWPRRSSSPNRKRSPRCVWRSVILCRRRLPRRLSLHPSRVRNRRPRAGRRGRRRIMRRAFLVLTVSASALLGSAAARDGQAPGAASAPDLPVSHRDRVYVAEQFSNTVSVTDPADNKLLGVIRLGDPQPANLTPLYRGQLLVHGIGFSFDHKTLAVVSIGSNSVTFIDTPTNAIKHISYLGRAPHEAFFTPDGKEVWVT